METPGEAIGRKVYGNTLGMARYCGNRCYRRDMSKQGEDL